MNIRHSNCKQNYPGIPGNFRGHVEVVLTKFLIAFGFQFGTFRFVRIVREFGFGQVAFVVELKQNLLDLDLILPIVQTDEFGRPRYFWQRHPRAHFFPREIRSNTFNCPEGDVPRCHAGNWRWCRIDSFERATVETMSPVNIKMGRGRGNRIPRKSKNNE